MDHSKKQKFITDLLFFAALALLLYCFWKYALRWILPFLIAYIASALLNRPITWCQKRLGFQRGFSAAVFTLSAVLLFAALLFAFLSALLSQAYEFLLQAPQWLSTIGQRTLPLQNTFLHFFRACPPQLKDFLLSTLESFSQETGALLGRLSESFLAFCASLIRCLPNYLLFFITTVLAIFYTSARFPTIRTFLLRQLSFKQQKLAKEVKPQLFSTTLKWLKAELTLITITFLLLLSGFLLLRLHYALLLAIIIALVDALPILGVGTVLLPWAFFALATENFLLGISLIGLYLTVQLTHSLLEPRLIAAQAGLPSVAALFAMYVGFRILGLPGMIFCPLLLLLAKRLHDEGYFRLWK